jgi:uncharacterized protein YjbJ (UPF0337 family)
MAHSSIESVPDTKEGPIVGADDKIANKAEEVKGRVKENVGDATDDERLAAEGRADQDKSKFKQAGEKVKDAAEDVKDVFKR